MEIDSIDTVLDANILVRASPSAKVGSLATELLVRCLRFPNTLLISAPILVEVARVLQYPHLAKRWPLQAEDIDGFLSRLSRYGKLVSLPSSIPAVVSDPDDDPILQTAILGRAHLLCTNDLAFREPRVLEYAASDGVRIVTDVEAIHFLRERGQGLLP
ncbi:MAG: PIN domain-containing protein [Acidobacteria bacterium]|nr:PIN domain-containing protein [Acidobacteriota bacterium]